MKLSSIGVCCLIGLCAMNFAIANDRATKAESTESTESAASLRAQGGSTQKEDSQTKDGSLAESENAATPKPAQNINLKDVVDAPLLPEETHPKIEAQAISAAGNETTKETTKETREKTTKETREASSASNKKAEQPQKPNAQKPNAQNNALTTGKASSRTTEATTAQTKNLTQENSAAQSAPLTEQNNAPADASPKPGILKKLAQGFLRDDSEVGEPLVLLNSEVLPGVSTRLGWSAGASFSGISAPTAILVLNGVKPGPTFCITAAVHGDELNGIEIVRRIMYNIDPQELSGSIIGVPIVNLQGFRRGSRYLPDRRDLNRFFPGNPDGSSAARIAHSFFTEVISHCDMLVDLHTGSFRRTNLPQLRADLTNEKVQNLAKKMGAIVVVQSEGAEGCLRRAAVEHGIPAVTLEAGAPHELTLSDIEHGVKSIESAMDGLGMIKRRRFWERAAEPIYYESSWVRATDGGMLFSEIELGAEVVKGDLLGIVTDPITNKHSEIHAPYDGQIIGMALNQVMFPGFAAYHIGHKGPAAEEPELEEQESVKEKESDKEKGEPIEVSKSLQMILDPIDIAQTKDAVKLEIVKPQDTSPIAAQVQAIKVQAREKQKREGQTRKTQAIKDQVIGPIATEVKGKRQSENSISDSTKLTPEEDSE